MVKGYFLLVISLFTKLAITRVQLQGLTAITTDYLQHQVVHTFLE